MHTQCGMIRVLVGWEWNYWPSKTGAEVGVGGGKEGVRVQISHPSGSIVITFGSGRVFPWNHACFCSQELLLEQLNLHRFIAAGHSSAQSTNSNYHKPQAWFTHTLGYGVGVSFWDVRWVCWGWWWEWKRFSGFRLLSSETTMELLTFEGFGGEALAVSTCCFPVGM